jgi:hypothetical protein
MHLDAEVDGHDKPVVSRRPPLVRPRQLLVELEVEPPHELWEQFRHLEDRDVLADAGAGAQAELVGWGAAVSHRQNGRPTRGGGRGLLYGWGRWTAYFCRLVVTGGTRGRG